MKSIGIDLGTTTISAVVLDTVTNETAESRTVPNDTRIRTANEWERLQDAERILQKAADLLEELRSLHPDARAVGITGQMHGIVYLNAKGAVVSPLYTWQDGRGNLPGSGGRTLTEEIQARTGLRTHTGYGLVTHLWLNRAGLVPAGSTSLCTIGDALSVKLTGRRTPLLHAGSAAGLGFYDAGRHRFDTTALNTMGMNPCLLPETTAGFVPAGTWNGLPVCVAIGDNQAAFLGAAGLTEHVLALNMGTGGQVSVMTDVYCEIPGIETRPLTPDRWLLVGASVCGGYAYALLEQFYRGCLTAFGADAADADLYGVMENLARKGKGDGLQVQTAFLGTRENPELRGAVTGIRDDNFTPEALTRGVLEGMARELYEDYQRMRQGAGVRAERIVASGNGLRRNPVLREICADMFGMPLELSPRTEDAACGAAYAAASAAPAASVLQDPS